MDISFLFYQSDFSSGTSPTAFFCTFLGDGMGVRENRRVLSFRSISTEIPIQLPYIKKSGLKVEWVFVIRPILGLR